MRLIKYGLLFIIAFLVAWVLIFTFTQEPFYARVPARLITYSTPAIPIYIYVASAFAIGLLIGLIVLLYSYIVLKSSAMKKDRTIRELESQLADAQETIGRIELSQKAEENISEAKTAEPQDSKK